MILFSVFEFVVVYVCVYMCACACACVCMGGVHISLYRSKVSTSSSVAPLCYFEVGSVRNLDLTDIDTLDNKPRDLTVCFLVAEITCIYHKDSLLYEWWGSKADTYAQDTSILLTDLFPGPIVICFVCLLLNQIY